MRKSQISLGERWKLPRFPSPWRLASPPPPTYFTLATALRRVFFLSFFFYLTGTVQAASITAIIWLVITIFLRFVLPGAAQFVLSHSLGVCFVTLLIVNHIGIRFVGTRTKFIRYI